MGKLLGVQFLDWTRPFSRRKWIAFSFRVSMASARLFRENHGNLDALYFFSVTKNNDTEIHPGINPRGNMKHYSSICMNSALQKTVRFYFRYSARSFSRLAKWIIGTFLSFVIGSWELIVLLSTYLHVLGGKGLFPWAVPFSRANNAPRINLRELMKWPVYPAIKACHDWSLSPSSLSKRIIPLGTKSYIPDTAVHLISIFYVNSSLWDGENVTAVLA